MLISTVISAGLIIASLNWPFATVKQTVTNEYSISPSGTLHVESASGDIRVRVYEGASVRLVTTTTASSKRGLEDLKTDVSTSNGTLSIQAVYPSRCTNCDISYDIFVPKGVAIVAGAQSGNITVDGAKSFHGRTASGDIKLSDVNGDVDAQAASGDVTARFNNVAGVREIKLGAASGDVKLTMPRNAPATISAQTESGSIASDFGQAPNEGYAGATLSQTVGDGRVKIHLSVNSGSIKLRAI